MAQVSAGILLYRLNGTCPEVFLIHMGGPFWARRDAGAWSIPKGLVDEGEELLAAALREFREETGQLLAPAEPPHPLSPIRQSGGKVVHTWAVKGNADPEHIVSNTFQVESPRGQGGGAVTPKQTAVAWLGLAEAHDKIVTGQRGLLDELAALLGC